jgi:purine-cytosine permease-like protein
MTLVLWLPVAPLLLILAVGWTTAEAARRWPALQRDVSTTAPQWMARGVLVVVFAVAVADLIADISSLS